MGAVKQPHGVEGRFITMPKIGYEEDIEAQEQAGEQAFNASQQAGFGAAAGGAVKGSASQGVVPVRPGAAWGGPSTATTYDPTRGAHKPQVGPYAGMVPPHLQEPKIIEPYEGKALADSIRDKHNLPQDKKNVAIADAKVDGKRITKPAISGFGEMANPSGTAGNPTNRKFTTTTVRNIPRGWDSEVKLLELIAEDLTPESVGVVNLYTERPPCASCGGTEEFLGVIDQFQEMFPRITVNIRFGPPPSGAPKTAIRLNLLDPRVR
jgi:hypothetical protein